VLTADERNDGFLYAGELFAHVPVAADLVVLSACETALGRDYAGEGLIGLARAFMLAGTPRVLASLWKVEDAATQALMRKFYELWNPKDGTAGMGAAAALRAAQAFVRSQEAWQDPRFWAAWVLWGLPD
jgi:CHAT domain-containing protein